MTISTPMLVIFLIYIFGMIFIGFIAYKATHSFNDYILGGRRLGSLVTALSAGASDMSGWLLMGLPGAIFLYGISSSWIAVGLIIGAYLNWLFVAGRLRVHTEVNKDSLTLPNYFSNRFNDQSKLLRVISAFVILVFFTIYCASGIVASARLLETTFEMPYSTALWLGAAATIAYTFIGGFLAISWTDSVQATLMIFALILTPIMVMLSVGGFDASIAMIKAKNAANLNMFEGLNGIGIISFLGWGLGYFGQPHILARFMAADSHHTIHRARRISITWMILCLTGAIGVGLFGIAYFSQHPENAIGVSQNSERVFIELTKLLFNPWIAGILLSAVLSAVMSSLSCQLLVCSSAITEDLYKPFFRQNASQKELIWVGRSMVLLVALVAVSLASDPDNRVLSLVSYAWAGFGAAFGPVILISVFWKNMTRNGALTGMLVGAATVIIWKQGAWFGLYEIIPGFLFSSITIYFVSLYGKKPHQKILDRFEKSETQFKVTE
ncbi:MULTISPECIES: sodium/proline symporter PutP [Candidatus Hamiltonella]|uniref:Sodium/proline symporter n=2 Tax=Candidatus Williamhamiltonella defendens TaxID=138072 RepID=C4K5M6_HAMD5|nr:sodium/proline symporter PutP [Candidatus Hamiltonella defensa]ACQ67869.1 major sodium:proline symporter (SSS family) [Candidatus Hamiltonella defensa 5AT (Acyrthosiphon pisum)]ATW22515.1 sodium/proline symporter [Candidatus Hamiltonella defensa]ATW33584.1 sodium/proline symporter [Candidatus Hamiltonella defensa]